MNFIVQSITQPPLSCDLQDEPSHRPSARDLDLARHLCPGITEDPESIFFDGEFCFYPVEVQVPNERRTLRNNHSHEPRMMWVRSTFHIVSNYPHEPDDCDETNVDGMGVFRSLSDAIKQTLLDRHFHHLDSIDNSCPACHGMGSEEHIDGVHHCPRCKGSGWNPISPPPVHP